MIRFGWFVTVSLIFALGLGCSSGSSEPSASGGNGGETSAMRHYSPEAGSLLVEAHRTFEGADYFEALRLTGEARKKAPPEADLASVHYLRGRILTKLNRYDAARKAFRRVLDSRDQYRNLWYRMGATFFLEGDYESALRYYRREFRQSPRAKFLLEIGRTYREMGRPDSARRAFERALERDSTYAPAYYQRARLGEEQGRLEEALGSAYRALRLDSANLDYRYLVGELELRSGRPQRAIRHLRPVVEREPWRSGGHYNLARSLQRLGRQDEAEAHFVLADSMQSLENQISQRELSAKQNPSVPDRWIHYGRALEKAGRYREARGAYVNALRLAPDRDSIRNRLQALSERRLDR